MTSHEQEEAFARSEAAQGASAGKENEKRGQREESSRHKMRKNVYGRGTFKMMMLLRLLVPF